MTAAYLVIFRTEQISPNRAVAILFESIVTGIAWTGTAIVIWRLSFAKSSIEPGAWLLAILGIMFFFSTIVEFWPKDFLIVPEPVTQAMLCVALALPTLSKKMDVSWKIFLGALVILKVLFLSFVVLNARSIPLFPNAVEIVDHMWLATGGLVPIVITSATWKRRSEFSFLHWVGIVFFCANCLIHLTIKLL